MSKKRQHAAKSADPSRPEFAIEPGPDQESVWDYPRPPCVRGDGRLIEVFVGSETLARSSRTYKVMETASPPTFYIPNADIDFNLLVRMSDSTYCEWKGSASYWALRCNPTQPVGWCYRRPRPGFENIRDHVAFYPDRVNCRISGERVRAQPGRFYGGWITTEVVGPFKGEPGTGHW